MTIRCWCGLPPANHNGNLARLEPSHYAGHEYEPIEEAFWPRCGAPKPAGARWCFYCTDWQERYDEAPSDAVTA